MSKNIDFVNKRKLFYRISAVLVALSILLSLVLGVDLDISFKGGCMATYSSDAPINDNDAAAAIEKAIGQNVSIQTTTDINTGRESIVVSLSGTDSLTTEEQTKMTETLEENFPDVGVKLEGTTNIDPSMGMEFLVKCLVAVVLASVLMLIYIAFRFRKIGGASAGTMSVVALIHDAVMVYTAFVVFRFPLDSNLIAAVLTILGYSINATIVVYDRIRENERLYPKMDQAELINLSLNQSKTRTVRTTVSTVIALVVVSVVAIIYNVTSILTFTLPLIVGMISGLYSSMCLAPQLWYTWQLHAKKVKAERKK